jgi:hypothetical protein
LKKAKRYSLASLIVIEKGIASFKDILITNWYNSWL